MLGSIAFNYWMAIAIARRKAGPSSAGPLLALTVGANLVVLGVFMALADFDWQWMRDNFRFIATGLWVTILTAVYVNESLHAEH